MSPMGYRSPVQARSADPPMKKRRSFRTITMETVFDYLIFKKEHILVDMVSRYSSLKMVHIVHVCFIFENYKSINIFIDVGSFFLFWAQLMLRIIVFPEGIRLLANKVGPYQQQRKQ